jgi:3-mercaptopyruvate sulfurtransferase SseA
MKSIGLSLFYLTTYKKYGSTIRGGEGAMKKRFLFILSVIIVLTFVGSGVSFAKLAASQTGFPNAKLLVSADSVQETAGTKNFVIIDARSAGYDSAHIPGAINIKFGDYFTPGTGLLPVVDLNNKLSAAGLKRSMTFVIYDNTTGSFGAAGRIFWMLEYLGCNDVHILDGGWDKWVADERPTEITINTLPPAIFRASVEKAKRTTKERISKMLGKKNFAIIDSRADEEYNGWQRYGETRGGHIPGAFQLSYASFFNSDKTVLKYSDLKTMFESRGITRKKEVTAYCTVGIRSGFVYFLYRLMGYSKASNYDGSIAEWSADPSLPMEKASRFSALVYPAWVKTLIDYHKADSTSSAPPEYPYDRNHKYLIFETQWGSFEDMEKGWADNSYLLGHIPGAIHSNSDIYENGEPRWFLNPDADLHTMMGSMGITADTTVIVYSNSPSFAARLWWILKYAGVSDVRMLNGGYEQWFASGYAGETAINDPVPATFSASVHPEYLATTDYVFTHYTNTGSTIIADNRSWDEHIGAKSGYGYLLAKGRIPNSVWVKDEDEYDDADNTLRSYTEIRDMWSTLGIISTLSPTLFDKEVIFHCGGGYRSSLTFFFGYLMGYDNIRNYSDGWQGWSTTYTQNPSCNDGASGWCQTPSGRPIVIGTP